MFNNRHFIAVFAKSRNNVLGIDGTMPWHSHADFRWFKGLTKGNAVIMGRKTFESLPNGALPGRLNIVVTRQKDYGATNVVVVSSLKDAARYVMRALPYAIQYVIGGAELLTHALPYCLAAYVTEIDMTADIDGKKEVVFAPPLPASEVSRSIALGRVHSYASDPDAVVKHHTFTGSIRSVFQ